MASYLQQGEEESVPSFDLLRADSYIHSQPMAAPAGARIVKSAKQTEYVIEVKDISGNPADLVVFTVTHGTSIPPHLHCHYEGSWTEMQFVICFNYLLDQARREFARFVGEWELENAGKPEYASIDYDSLDDIWTYRYSYEGSNKSFDYAKIYGFRHRWGIGFMLWSIMDPGSDDILPQIEWLSKKMREKYEELAEKRPKSYNSE